MPEDGNRYGSSIEEIFPPNIVERIKGTVLHNRRLYLVLFWGPQPTPVRAPPDAAKAIVGWVER
jgi:hypothetical protein